MFLMVKSLVVTLLLNMIVKELWKSARIRQRQENNDTFDSLWLSRDCSRDTSTSF